VRGVTAVRSNSQSAEDSPQTWLLKQQHVKQWGQKATTAKDDSGRSSGVTMFR
jgi:hypothetical protein